MDHTKRIILQHLPSEGAEWRTIRDRITKTHNLRTLSDCLTATADLGYLNPGSVAESAQERLYRAARVINAALLGEGIAKVYKAALA